MHMSKRTKTSDIIDGLLIAVAAAGAVGIVIVAPNAIQAIEKPLEKFITNKRDRKELRRIARYLKRRDLVQIIENDDDTYTISLTNAGESRSKQVRFDRLEVDTGHWDERWRIIMFDIPEEYKTTRDYISRHLRQIGFKQLQRSVFIYPYAVDEFVALLKDMFPEIEKNLSYMTVEDLDQHNTFVKQFSPIL